MNNNALPTCLSSTKIWAWESLPHSNSLGLAVQRKVAIQRELVAFSCRHALFIEPTQIQTATGFSLWKLHGFAAEYQANVPRLWWRVSFFKHLLLLPRTKTAVLLSIKLILLMHFSHAWCHTVGARCLLHRKEICVISESQSAWGRWIYPIQRTRWCVGCMASSSVLLCF